MAEILATKNNKIKVVFDNDIDVDYHLNDSELANLWIKKIKHLQNVPVDIVESFMEDVSDIKSLYTEFCKIANIDPIEIEPLDQGKLNQLHQIYEENHDRLSKVKDNAILYKLHHSVHFHEGQNYNGLRIGWGKFEGPLTQQYKCHEFYADSIKKNNIYLPWAELGKTPFGYWRDKEPNNQDRFNELARPHTTFRAQFFIASIDIEAKVFDPNFVTWFDRYKSSWLNHHGMSSWDNVHEDSAPLLATTDYQGDLAGLKFQRIILQ